RAWVTHRTRPAPDPAALLDTVADDGFDPLAESWVEDGPGIGDAGAPRGHAAEIVVDEPDAVEIDATLAAPGRVGRADTWAPGWQATVDGMPAPILRTNYLFRGVAVPAGAHHVRFAYQSRTLAVGGISSAVGWLGMALLALRRR